MKNQVIFAFLITCLSSLKAFPLPSGRSLNLSMVNFYMLSDVKSRSINPENIRSEKGKGYFVGSFHSWEINNNSWWRESEIKFYLDGNKEFSTICGTGLTDYFCGLYDFIVRIPQSTKRDEFGFRTFTTPYLRVQQIIKPNPV
jgi:hypothetical protein